MATSHDRRLPLCSPASLPPPLYDDACGHFDDPARRRGEHTTIIAVGAHGPRFSGYSDQTIPKETGAGDMPQIPRERVAQESNTSNYKQRLAELNSQHTCASTARHHDQQPQQSYTLGSTTNNSQRKLSSPPVADSRGHDRFVQSLAAPRSFLGCISIEPLAFLAILALYIEFPAIQDLIYTKICLEVIAKHPDLLGAQRAALINAASNTTGPQPSIFIAQGLSNATQSQLPAGGRIQQQTSSLLTNGTAAANNGALIIPSLVGDNHQAQARQQHSLCDRLNKTAVPRAVRQEILDIDSLFWLKYQILVCSLCALASPYWGGLSDKIGRLIPLNAPILAGVASNTISLVFGLLISMDSHSFFHINWLFLGAVVVGLSGGQAVLIMNAFSFLSDNTTSEERSKRVTTLESVIFVAHSVGFFLSKMIMLLGLGPPNRPWLNRHFVAFAACVALNVISILYSVAKLRHRKFHRFLNNYERERQEAAILGSSSSLSGAHSSSSSLGRAKGNAGKNSSATNLEGSLATGERLRELTSSTPDDPDGPIARSDKTNWTFWDTMVTFRYYKETFEIATKQRETRSTILLLLLSGFVSSLSLAALMSLLFVYVKMEPFNWSTSQYSSWNSISSITRGVALIGLTVFMKLAPSWNVPDPIVSAIGFLGKGAGLLIIGLAHSSTAVNWSLVAFTFSEYSMPPIRSLLSKLVVREELCRVYSCLGSLQSLCFILGNIAFYVAFTSYTQQDFFRISFLVVGGIELSAVVVMLAIYSSR